MLLLSSQSFGLLMEEFPQYVEVWRFHARRRESQRAELLQRHLRERKGMSYRHLAAFAIQRRWRSAPTRRPACRRLQLPLPLLSSSCGRQHQQVCRQEVTDLGECHTALREEVLEMKGSLVELQSQMTNILEGIATLLEQGGRTGCEEASLP